MSSENLVPVIVFGEGSAAVFLISQLVKRNEQVLWVSGSGAKLTPVMPFVKSELALSALLNCSEVLDANAQTDAAAESLQRGTFHRVFRNKGFKMPSWKRSASLEAQQLAFEDLVWEPEQAFIGLQELRFGSVTPAAIEQSLRDLFENHPQVKKLASAPIIEFEVLDNGGKIQFSNGVLTEFKQFFFCDSLSELKAFPKLATVFKHQLGNIKMSNRVSAVQVMFHHSKPLKQTMNVGMVIPMNRDAGETFDRDVMGYFMEPNKSVWTVFMQMDEIEENHEIMKKLRKMKQSLNRAFDSPEFLPDGSKDFMATVEREHVRFEEGCLLIEGTFRPSKSNPDFVLLSDALGVTTTLEKVAELFEIEEMSFSLSDSGEKTETESESEIESSEAMLGSIEEIEMPAHLINADHASLSNEEASARDNA